MAKRKHTTEEIISKFRGCNAHVDVAPTQQNETANPPVE